MARSKDGSQKKGRGKALGVVGVSLSLAGAACAESSPADAATSTPTSNVRTVPLHEVEISDVTLGSFRVFDREDRQDLKGETVAWWVGGCYGCRGCRGCGCRGCRGCRGCGG
jgi:hypothetical protein